MTKALRDSRGRFIKGHETLNEWKEKSSNINKGKHYSLGTEFKKGIRNNPNGEFKKGHISLMGKDHPSWKGNQVSYSALHKYIAYYLGEPEFCEGCGTDESKAFDWANISGEYKRDFTDWLRLCRKCHVKFDDIFKKRPKDMYLKGWITRHTIKAYKKGEIPIICLAAGYGTRLQEITKDIPKPMIKIAGKPILEHILTGLSKDGLRKYIINLHYLPSKITEYIGNRALYFHEPKLLGHIGTIHALRDWLIKSPVFMVINCDTLIPDVDYKDMIYKHKPNSITQLASEHRAAGVWIYSREYFNNPDLPLFMYRPRNFIFFDCGTPERLEEARKYYEQ